MIYVIYCKEKGQITELICYTTKEADAKTITHHMNEEMGTIYKEYCYKALETISEDKEDEQIIITVDDLMGISKEDYSKIEDAMRVINRNRDKKKEKGEQSPNSCYRHPNSERERELNEIRKSNT